MNIDSMIQGNPQALVTSYNGVLVADSLEVAERFGKSHKNVLQTIDNLVTNLAAEFSATNAEPESYFIPSDYQNRGKTYKKYLLTRDGFSLLVMGFTGPAALHVSVPCRGTTFLNTIPTIPPPVWAHGRDCVGKIFLEKQIKFIRLNRQQTQYLSHARQNPNRYSLLLRNINFTLSHHIFFPLIAGTFQNMW